MLPRLGVGVIFFSVLSSCLGVWTTEEVRRDDRQIWEIRGSQAVPEARGVTLYSGNVGGHVANGVTDHIHMVVGGDLQRKMDAIVQLFGAHFGEIQGRVDAHDANNPENNRLSQHGWRMIRDVNVDQWYVGIEVTRAFERDIYRFVEEADQLGRLGRAMITFERRDLRGGVNVWRLKHLGPFSPEPWAQYDALTRQECERLQGELQPLLIQLQTQLDAAVEHVRGLNDQGTEITEQIQTDLTRIINDQQEGVRVLQNGQQMEERRTFDNILDDQNVYTFDITLIGPQLWDMTRFHNLQRKRVHMNDLINNLRRIHDPPADRAARVWGEFVARGPRKRRSLDSAVTLNAELELIDSDPNSEFMISKVEFKERYRQGQDTEFTEETHCVDFEKNVFVTDPNKAGSKLTAEIEENGTFKPAKVEEAKIVKRISIVLKPRGA